MSAYRVTDDEHRESLRSGRDDMLRIVRQRLSQKARVVRLSGRTRRAVSGPEPTVVQPVGSTSDRD